MLINYLIRYSWAIWNGAGFTAITGYSVSNWQWWAFTMPMVILVVLRDLAKEHTHDNL